MTATMTKAARAVVKAAGPADGLQEGEFRALVSVFNNVDTYGDVVMPGAFTDTLADYEAKGDPIPVVWSHDWTDPFAHIGYVKEAEQTADGLVVTAAVDLADNPKAAQVYRLLKGRRVTQFSFAFDVIDGGWGTRKAADGRDIDVFELRKIALHEVGPCLVGVNRDTALQGVKAVRDAFPPPPKSTDADPAPVHPEEPGRPVDRPEADAVTPAGDASAIPPIDPASADLLAAKALAADTDD